MLNNDLPTLQDKLDWKSELDRIKNRIRSCPTPHVVGIHGDWGSGKTSFMRQVQFSLGGDMPTDASVGPAVSELASAEKKVLQREVVTIWFDAWRYQNETMPVVALLQEMRKQMAFLPAIQQKFKKFGTLALYSVLDSLSSVGKAIGIDAVPNVDKLEKRGETWENEHFAKELSIDSIRSHLHQAIECLLPSENARVIIFIDDLDRCNAKAAMRLLEGLKIYFSIPRCVFVLGMNERVLVDAIREEVAAPKDATSEELKLRASHYLEKICTDIYRLPLPSKPAALLAGWIPKIEQKQAMLLAIGDMNCLPPNPRRLKALANQWSRFAACITFPDDHEQKKIWAVRILVTAYIHQFHRDLWERWHFNFDFWSEIPAWCNGERETPKPEWTGSLKLPRGIAGYEAATSKPIFRPIYTNPGDIDNFWIGELIQAYSVFLKSADFVPLLSAAGVNR